MTFRHIGQLSAKHSLLWVISLTGCLLFLNAAPPFMSVACAQGAPITSSGLNTVVTTNGNIHTITGGTRPGNGPNLFHSFGEFNVPNNNIANFLNAGSVDLAGNQLAAGLPTSNILGRVTAGNPSNIFGTIQTTNFGNANLFLMNPAGIIFGPNASLDVGGSVTFTEANYIRLADQKLFTAAPSANDAVLSTFPVAAFGFLDANPQGNTITVEGSTLSVPDGQMLSFIGKDFTMTGGRLSAPGGQIRIASVASAGEILQQDLGTGPNINGQTFTAMGTINLSQGATVDVSADAAGTVKIRGGQFVIADATLSADTINTNGAPTAIDINVTDDLAITDTRAAPAITARTTGAGDAGLVLLSSRDFTASSSAFTETPSTLIDTHTSASGGAGPVSITSGNVTAAGPGGLWFFIDSGTQGAGHGGNVAITAQEMPPTQGIQPPGNVQGAHMIDLTSARISTGTLLALINGQEATGAAGNLTITADSLRTKDSGLNTSAEFPAERSGDMTMNVREISMLNSSVSASGFVGGAITINADTLIADATQLNSFTELDSGGGITFNGRVLELTNGSSMSTSTFGDAPAGDINVTATDHVSLLGITGPNPIGEFNPSGLFSNAFGFFGTQGSSGNIRITTPLLTVREGRINTSTADSGHGGNVTINADTVSISGEFPNRFGAEIFFTITDIHPSGIFTHTVGNEFCAGPCGNAGNIIGNIGSLVMGPGSQMNSGTSSTGNGGGVTIHATDTIAISGTLSDGTPGGIFSRTIGTEPGSGNGGIIDLHAQHYEVTNGSQIAASTLGPGNAGSVSLQGPASPAQSILISGAGSGIFTTTEGAGAGGNVLVDSATVTVQNGGSLSAATSGTAPSATGGNITVTAGNSIQVNGGGSVSVQSTGVADAGNIFLGAGVQLLLQDGSVTASANQAGGGNITTVVGDTVKLVNSQLNSSVFGGTGGGGNINIDPQFVILQNSRILARAVQGNGGNINITTQVFLADASSVVDASSQFGVNGTVNIQSPTSQLSGRIVPLSQSVLQTAPLLSQRCAAKAAGEESSFVMAGRETLPTEPGGWLGSPTLASPLTPALSLAGRGEMMMGMGPLAREPALSLSKGAELGVLSAEFLRAERSGTGDSNGVDGTTQLVSLRRLTPAGFLTQSFPVDWSGCPS